jgi:cyclomaltodextrinase
VKEKNPRSAKAAHPLKGVKNPILQNIMKNIKSRLLIFLLAVSISPGCKQKAENDQLASVPEWAREVIWYQIFVERFRNGDTSNDPSITDIQGSYPGTFPSNWEITPWGHDWYAHEPWLDSVKA